MTSSGIAALLQDYRRFAGSRLWLALALMIIGSLAEGFGLLMIVPLIGAAVDRGRGIPARYAPFASDWTAGKWFAGALILFLCAMALRAIILFARDLLLARLQAEYESDLRLRSASTLASRGWPFASRIGQDGMQALLLTEVPRAAQATAYVQMAALGGVMLLVQLGIAFFLSPALAAAALAFMVVGSALSARLAVHGVRSGYAISDSLDQSVASGFRLHAGLKASLAQGSVGAFLSEYRNSLLHAADRYSCFAKDVARTRQVAGFAAALTAAILLFLGVHVLELPLPVLLASLAVFARMTAPAQMLQNSALQALAYAPSFAAIERRLDRIEAAPQDLAPGSPVPWRHLEADKVSYAHSNGRGVAEVSFKLRAGEWLALVGQSGAGKTTLVDLIAGLLEPQSGTIAIDGERLTNGSLTAWQAGLAYVGQDGAIFSDTVRRNLLAGTARDEELWMALAAVGLAERVRIFSNGLDEPLGDRGSLLSGGERQRLMIARAILRRPRLLILDEATSALDAEGEANLIEALRALQPRPAALVIAHRESTLAHCDSRLVIQHDPKRD